MAVQLFDGESERAASPALTVMCSCSAMALSSPAGEVIVVTVAGEVDLFTIAVLRNALADSLARGPRDLIVDVAAMTFCDLGGLSLLVETGTSAAGSGIGYAVAGVPAQTNRVWSLLWPVTELPTQFAGAAAGVAAAMARFGDDRARWAPQRGPARVRHWSASFPEVRPAPIRAELTLVGSDQAASGAPFGLV